MYKLLNMADFYSNEELEKEMKYFSKKYGFDGFELIKFTDNDNTPLKEYIKGYHIRFFPSWMEFYLEDFISLYDELKDKKYFKSLCGGENSKDELVNYFKKELEIAKTLEVEYIVFHACNIKIIESLTYNFKYSDMEVLKNVVDILNEIFEGGNYNFKLLLENLWWSGLRLTNKEEIEYLLKNINYKNVGFILDTGHMINNNPEIKNSKEAVEYIKKNLKNIEEYKKYIFGMHLNYSLSGDYVKKTIEKNRKQDLDIRECMKTIYEHINNIDYHDPFEDKEITEVINSLPIKYLVFELIGNTKEELENKIQRQLKIFE
ncbi:sugar phosphate isomerase/epimerase [Fusobacterium simiae]|uniref:Sugar phosphate isomerase/epimerase n=1 Tax=Fusobacterium simiae TaxID=855 RepID=A0ABT4DIN3_FUSSI|nr:sugar phosphate isomerase/epimerase [Fusobacterium simiae]MCY7008456.1 sugar phosphate isomerase/epimerase [Fusobacterium simiae]